MLRFGRRFDKRTGLGASLVVDEADRRPVGRAGQGAQAHAQSQRRTEADHQPSSEQGAARLDKGRGRHGCPGQAQCRVVTTRGLYPAGQTRAENFSSGQPDVVDLGELVGL